MIKFIKCFPLICAGLTFTACSLNESQSDQQDWAQRKHVPADRFDLSNWSIMIPVDRDGDGGADSYSVAQTQSLSHPDFFYLDELDRMVFASPNRATTSPTSTNTRSEMHYMLRGEDTSISIKSPLNNFALASHKDGDKFAAIGGKMEASLHVDHVSKNAAYPNKPPAYSVVIGQIHAQKRDEKIQGFGWGNEPLKISYKKWPDHETGSVFWAYERNLTKEDPFRTDIAYTVWGSDWDESTDPGESGIALGEAFSYKVNVYEDVMHLTFSSSKHDTIHHKINLANNVDATGVVDQHDHPLGYRDEPLYFKAGAYNQCSTKSDDPSFRYPGCAGTGDWETDKLNGDYVQATFLKLSVGPATPE